MRGMNLSEFATLPNSLDECVNLYSERLPADDARWPHVSLLLTAYVAWPNDEARRDSFVATYLARSEASAQTALKGMPTETHEKIAFESFGGIGAVAEPAFDHLLEKITPVQRRWSWVADIFHLIVDMAYDDRIVLRRGSSVSKAIDLCEIERGFPGHSQLRKAWSESRDVAHLITASAHLAHSGLANTATAKEASILKAIWIAPDAVLALAAGFQHFGLQPKSIRGELPILRPDKLWRIPPGLVPEPFIVFRRLTETQLAFLDTRRAPKKYTARAR